MPILFNNIPGNIRVPLFYAEFNAGGTPYTAIARLLLIGQMKSPIGAVTVTVAAPGVFTLNNHGFKAGTKVVLQSSGALPTGLAEDTNYYVISTGLTANNFQLATAPGGTAITTTGTQSGTHTAQGYMGSAVPGIPLLMRDGQEEGLFGVGSMLTEMYKTARENAPFQEIWCLPLADDAAGVRATGTILIAGAPVPAAASLTVYIGSKRLRIAVRTTDTNANIAQNLADEINENLDLPVSATVSSATITLKAHHAGAQGNFIKISTNQVGDESPIGAALLSVTPMSGGDGDPEIEEALANLGDDEYDWIAAPYSDTTNLGYVDDLLNDESGRWSPISQLYGHYITAKDANLAALSTAGNALNNQHVSILGYYQSPTPPWIWAAAIGGQTAKHLQSAPELSRPLQTLDLRNVVAPPLEERFNVQERQVLYFDGIASYHVERDGTVSIDRLITTYQFNEWGSPDATWLDIETMAQSMFGIRYLKQKVTNIHARQALADENVYGNQGVTTAEDIRNTIIHGYAELVRLAVFENLDLFDQDLIVERDQVDANRVNVYMPLDHVNQLRIVAVNATSYMQRRSAVLEQVSLTAR